MQDRHEPSDRFIERLGQDIGVEVRRRNLQPSPVSLWPAFGLKTVAVVAALVVVSMAVGGAVVAAAYQNENREELRALKAVYERKLLLAKVRLDAARQQLQDAERRVAVGLENQKVVVDQQQAVNEAEAQLRIATLNIEEVAVTGREPRDEVSAPSISNRDFVQERLVVGMSITQGALDAGKRKLQDAQRRVSIGIAQPADVDALRAEIVGLESALQATQQKIAARQSFVGNKYDPVLTDLRVGEIEAEQRLRALAPQLDLAKRDMARIESLVTKGLTSPTDVAQARVRILEIELKLSMAQAELSTVRARIAERTAGKGSGS